MKQNFVLLTLLFIFCATEARAIGGFTPVIDVPEGGGVVNGATFSLVGKANHSYVCGVRVNGADFSISASVLNPSSQPITGLRPINTAQAERYVSRFFGTEPADTNPTDNFVFFVAPNDSAATGKYTLTLGITSPMPGFLSALCVDTTAVCEFNTYINDANFLEVSNLGTDAGRVKLVLINSDGSKTVAPNTLTIPAGVRRDIDIHTIAGAQNYGTILLQFLDADLSEFAVNPRVSNYKQGNLENSVRCDASIFFFGV